MTKDFWYGYKNNGYTGNMATEIYHLSFEGAATEQILSLTTGDTVSWHGTGSVLVSYTLDGFDKTVTLDSGGTFTAPVDATYTFSIDTDLECDPTNINGVLVVTCRCCGMYQADRYGHDAGEEIIDNGDGTFSWEPAVEGFEDFLVRVPPCCEVLVTHSATVEGQPLRFRAGPAAPRYFSASFRCNISDLVFTSGSADCLEKLYIQVKRG